MCGICGLFDYGAGIRTDAATVQLMTERMRHRGPDDGGLWSARGVALGVRRLAVVDTNGGRQPMKNESGEVVAVYNGEIYNFPHLRRELEGHGHVFRTRCDSEVVVHAYEQWGERFLERLNGMFALALLDQRTGRLLLARDPFGIKPLYVHCSAGMLAFASEVRSLLAWRLVPCEVDVEALPDLLVYGFVPSPGTPLRGVARLPPGHRLLAGPGLSEPRVERFVPEEAPRIREDLREREAVEGLRERLGAAVRRQLVSDVPVGVLLSGGLDSGLLAALMTEARGEPVETFTVGFAGSPKSELAVAREAARRLGARHHELELSQQDFLDLLGPAVRAIEEPLANPTALPFLAVSRLARERVTVALCGQGADEAFGGYDRYVGEHLGTIWRVLPAPLRAHLLEPVIEFLPRSERLKRAAGNLGMEDPWMRAVGVRAAVRPERVRDLLRTPATGASTPGTGFQRWRRDVGRLAPLAGMLYVDTRTSLPDNLLLFGDKTSMATSLEVRVPYLDIELMRFVETIPTRLKVGLRRRKHVLVAASRQWLPPARRKKIGFETPFDGWFRGSLAPELRERVLGGAVCTSYLDRSRVEQTIAEHISGRHDHKRLLFGLLALSVWHEEIVESRAGLGLGDARAAM